MSGRGYECTLNCTPEDTKVDAQLLRFLATHTSSQQASRVLATIRRLVNGQGLTRPRETESTFMRNERIGLLTADVSELKRRAEEWLPARADTSNGMRWRTPLNWLSKFQAHRRAMDELTEASAENAKSCPPDATKHRPMALQKPTELQQLLRTCGEILPLVDYLKQHGAFEKSGKRQWKMIRRWVQTEEGYEWVQKAGLDPYSIHLHHVKSASRGGMYSVYNCVFLPGGINSSFGAADSEAMREFVGQRACQLSDRHAVWHARKTEDIPDQSDFRDIAA